MSTHTHTSVWKGARTEVKLPSLGVDTTMVEGALALAGVWAAATAAASAAFIAGDL